MNAVGIIALVLIILAVVKMLYLLFSPKSWMNMAKKLAPSVIARFIALILAVLVFYYLLMEVTVVQILAVTAFVGLLIFIGLAPHMDSLIKKYDTMIKKGRLWKDNLLYVILWLILLVWGVKELFF